MAEFIATSGYFGLLMTTATFLFARFVNRKAGKEVLNPLLFSTICCIVFLLSELQKTVCVIRFAWDGI